MGHGVTGRLHRSRALPERTKRNMQNIARVLLLALCLAVALTILVVGCAIDDSWWSLLTATFYLLALGCWSLFRPGCMPCVQATQPGMAASTAGCCGGKLWMHWGSFLTSFFGFSTFGVASVMYHADKVEAVSFATSMASGAIIMGIVVIEVQCKIIGGGRAIQAAP